VTLSQTRTHGLAIAASLLLSANVLLFWVIPIVAGPTVQCGDRDPIACDQVWHEVAAEQEGVIQMLFPVTAASVGRGEECPSVYLEWLWGVFALSREC
jgi:hypothetical protein